MTNFPSAVQQVGSHTQNPQICTYYLHNTIQEHYKMKTT